MSALKHEVPHWKAKVISKKIRETDSTKFVLSNSFPGNPIRKWNGMEASKETPKMPDFMDQEVGKHKNYRHWFEKVAKEDPMNHFVLYSLLMKRMNQEKHIYIGQSTLLNMLSGIARSPVLNQNERVYRFTDVANRYSKEGHPKRAEFWEHYVKCHSEGLNGSNWDEFMATVKDKSARVYGSIIDALAKNGEPDLAEHLYMEYISKSHEPGASEVRNLSVFAILDAYRLKGDTQKIKSFIEYLKRSNIYLGNWMGQRLIQSIVDSNIPSPQSKHDILFIVDYLKSFHQISLGIHQLLYEFAVREQDKPYIKSLENEINQLGYNLEQIKARVNLLLVAKNPSSSIDRLQSEFRYAIRNGKYVLETPVVNLFINRVAEEAHRYKKGDIFSQTLNFAYHIQSVFHHVQGHTDSASYTSLLKLFAYTRNEDRCASYIKQINRRGHLATVEHYYHFIHCLSLRGSVLTAKDTLKEMYNMKLQPSLQIYNVLIEAYLKQPGQPNFTKALALLRQFPDIWHIPDETTIDLFLNAFRRQDIFPVEYFYEALVDMNFKPSIKVYNKLMSMYFDIGQYQKVLAKHALMQKEGITENAETLEILIKTYLADNNYTLMKLIWKGMDPEMKTLHSWTSVLKATANEGDTKGYLKELNKCLPSGFNFDRMFFESILQDLVNLKTTPTAVSIILDQIKDPNQMPNDQIMNSVLNELDQTQKDLILNHLQTFDLPTYKKVTNAIIPIAETNQRKLHDNFVELELSFSEHRRVHRRTAKDY